MKVIISKKVGGEFLAKVVLSDTNVLAVRLENDNGEYVGQIFTSLKSVADMFERITSGEKLSKDDLAEIKKVAPKTEGVTRISRAISPTDEGKKIKTKVDLENSRDNVFIPKGTVVTVSVKRDKVTVMDGDQSITLEIDDAEDLLSGFKPKTEGVTSISRIMNPTDEKSKKIKTKVDLENPRDNVFIPKGTVVTVSVKRDKVTVTDGEQSITLEIDDAEDLLSGFKG